MKTNKRITILLVLFVVIICATTLLSACSKQMHNITFYADGSAYNRVQTNGYETIKLPEAPTKSGYTFVGWYYDQNIWSQPFSSTDFAEKGLTADISVYARFISNEQLVKHNIMFVVNGEIIDSFTTFGFEAVSLPNASVVEGYTFVGWYYDQNVWQQPFDENDFVSSALSKDVYVYARYELTQHTISFVADGQTVHVITTSGYQTLTLPQAPKKPNYNFLGWYYDNHVWHKQLTATSYANSALTDDITVYAYYKYSPTVNPQYPVTFYGYNNVILNTVMSSGNEYIALPDAPNVQGYSFEGWYLDKNVWNTPFDGYNYLNSAITTDINVYAYYRKVEVKYTVSFETYGGTKVDDMYVSVINSSPVTTKVGPYEFDGWYFDSNFTRPVTFPYYPDGDITLYAKWIEVEVTFTLDEYNYISGVSAIPEDGNLVIPSYVNGVKVIGIASSAFQRNKELKSVTIPQGIKYLYPYAFHYCTNLQSVVIGEGMKSIKSFAFDGCSSLTSISFPSSLTSIDQGAFMGTGFKQIRIPDTVEYIGQFAFQDCSNLVDIDLGSVKVLGQGVFKNCSSLQAITLPDTIKELEYGGDGLFYYCKKLSSITLPNKAIRVSHSMFDYTAYYENEANWQDGVLYVGKYLIAVNDKFTATTYSVKEGTEVIADNAFTYYMSNSKLTTVSLPQGLKIIGEQAFYNYTALSSCNIPDSVEKIGKEAFRYTLLVKEGQTNYVGNWLINYVLGSGETTLTVKEGTVGIADGQITGSNNSTVTKINLPNSLKYIGTENFKYFQALTTVTSSAALQSIGNNAFENCFALQEFDLSKSTGLKYIGDTAFSWCKVYDNIYIPKSVVYLGEDVFNNVTGTISIEINQAEIPDSWNSSWNVTYGPELKIQWGISNPSA